MIEVDGMLQLGDGLLLRTIPRELATIAVTLNAVNLVGGFLVTHKMLKMSERRIHHQNVGIMSLLHQWTLQVMLECSLLVELHHQISHQHYLLHQDLNVLLALLKYQNNKQPDLLYILVWVVLEWVLLQH